MDTRQASLIARFAARNSVRGGIGLVFLLLSLTFGLIVAQVMLQPVEAMVKEVRLKSAKQAKKDEAEVAAEVMRRIAPQVRPAVTWFLAPARGADGAVDEAATAAAERWSDHLVEERPLLMSAILLILLFGWPLCAVFGAFDLFAGDIASRQLRYQLLRADRASIYFGRLVGAMFTYVGVLAILGATVTLYIAVKLPIYDFWDLAAWSAYGVFALVVETLPYVALCAWVSASVSSSFVSLTVTSVIIGGVPLAAMFGRFGTPHAEWISWLLPWGFQLRLLHPDLHQCALAAGGCLLQAVVFTWLGYRKFTTRDL